MKNILQLMVLCSALLASTASADDIEYLGNGRYTCNGGGCDSFNASMDRSNQIQESIEMNRIEAREQQRQFELEQRLRDIDRKYDEQRRGY